MSLEEYLDKIRPSLRDIIIDLQEPDLWKIHLTMAIKFISSKDLDEERVMHTKSDNKEFMTYDNANDIVDELFEPLLSRYQDNLEMRTEGSEFVFDSVQSLYYKCHIINFRCGGSYIDSPDWIKKEKGNNKSEK